MRSRHDRAFSLVEAVLASFLLLTAVSMSIWVFDATMRASAENDRRLLATMAARNKLAEMRAQGAVNFTSGLTSYNGATSTAPEAPGMQILTRAVPKTLLSPCSSLENQYPAADSGAPYNPAPKAMTNSAWQVEVEVQWGDRPADRVVLVGYISDWRELQYTIRLTPDASTDLAPRETVGFKAEGVDGSGQPLDDLMFSWYVIPELGMGTISNVSRDGKNAQYKNYFRKSANEFDVMPGPCNVQARAVYRGQEQDAQYRITNEP